MKDELRDMRYAGKVNLNALNLGLSLAQPGVKLCEIDEKVEQFIRQAGCIPAFKDYQPLGYPLSFKHAACISVNSAAVHGVPNDYELQAGDLLTIDLGTECNGWFVDAARAKVVLDKASKRAQHLLVATNAILDAQLRVVKNQCSFLTLVEAAEEAAKTYGVNIVPQYGGHGIGNAIHQEPFVPNVINRNQSLICQRIETKRYERQYFIEGNTYCIEPVVVFGDTSTYIDKDGWTVYTQDKGLACHEERCVLITKEGYQILS